MSGDTDVAIGGHKFINLFSLLFKVEVKTW